MAKGSSLGLLNTEKPAKGGIRKGGSGGTTREADEDKEIVLSWLQVKRVQERRA